MGNVLRACVVRAVFVALTFAVLASTRPAKLSAQDAVTLWSGSMERLSSAAEYGWPDPAAAQVSRHASSEDGRLVVFTLEVPDDAGGSFKQFLRRDRLFGQLDAFFGAPAAAPPVISADGTQIALETCVGWWRSDQASICDVYVLDSRPFGGFVNASTALDGTESNARSTEPMLSRSGRYLVFRTDSTTLLPTAAAPGQIVLRDRDTDGNEIFDEPGGVSLEVVSVSSAGEAGNAASGAAQVSADGRFVAFRSLASNLVAGDTNGAWDVFLHDRQTGETRRINVGWDGQQATPTVDSPAISMTENGDLIAFAADDGYLTNPPTHHEDSNEALDVIVYNRQEGTLHRVDIGVNGTVANAHTFWPTFSADGRYLSVISLATNTEEPSSLSSGRAHVYVFDRVANKATRISRTPQGAEPNADSLHAAITGDGSFVTFVSQATNLGSSSAAGIDSVYGAGHLHAGPETLTIPGRGGEVNVQIGAQQYVPWTVELSDYTWLQTTGPLWGTGPASLAMFPYVNTEPVERSVSVRIGAQTLTVRQEAGLSLQSVSPSSGSTSGGTLVTVTGTGFEPDMTLLFDGTIVPFEFVSSTTVRTVTAAHVAGPVAVSVQTSDARYMALDGAFNYVETAASVSWSTPAPIVYGTALGAAQLTATANVPGSFVYSPAPGEILSAGSHLLSVTFTPADSSSGSVSATVVLQVLKATATVALQTGTYTYDAMPHPATGSVTGVGGATLGPLTFTYNASAAVPVDAGGYDVVAAFPGDENHESASAFGTLTITKAAPTVSVQGGTFVYDGSPHGAIGKVYGVGDVELAPLTFTYAGSPAPPVNAGDYAVVASFAGNRNYIAASATTTITIVRAVPTIQWDAPAPIVYGTPLGNGQLNAGSTIPGTFAYTPAAGTVLHAGQGQPLSVMFTPADAANYTVASASTAVTVLPAPLVVRAEDAVKRFGAPLPSFTATMTGFVNGDGVGSLAGALAFSTTASALSPIGTYAITPAGVSSPNYTVAFVNGTLTVVRGAVLVGVTTSPEPSGFNQPMTFTAVVSSAQSAPVLPSGMVRFYDGATLLGSATLSGGRASLSTAGLTPGTRTIDVRYEGDASFESGSAASAHVVRSAAETPAVTVSSSRNPANVGQTVTLTAEVTLAAGVVSGVVQFFSGTTLIGESVLSEGRATLITSALPATSHAIIAKYRGSPDVPPATSAVFVQAIGEPGWKDRPSLVTLTAALNPASLGDVVVVTATVSGSMPSAPSGRILILVNGEVSGDPAGFGVSPAADSSVGVTVRIPGLAHGRHTITATYLGDATYKGSTAQLVQLVN